MRAAFRRASAPPTTIDDLQQVTLLPGGIVHSEAAAAAVISGQGWPLAGNTAAFTGATVLWRERDTVWGAYLSFAELVAWSERCGAACAAHIGALVQTLGKPRPDWAELSLDRPRIMGIVNVTPDSFSDGGCHADTDSAIAHALRLVAEGADLVDVGGESTRPDVGDPPDEAEELRRVIPVIRALSQQGIIVSVDTRRAGVMRAALTAGATIINDVSALTFDPQALSVVADSSASVCLMHMRGTPQTMGQHSRYTCAPWEVVAELQQRRDACEAAGIDRKRILLDPGIGFAKTAEHNLQILATLPLLHTLGCGVLLAASRKRFIPACLEQDCPPQDRLGGSLAAVLMGLNAGMHMVRVHDVAATRQAVAVFQTAATLSQPEFSSSGL